MKFLFFITKLYSIAILKPLQIACNKTNVDIAWYKAGSASTANLTGNILSSSNEVRKYNPDAVIVPGNVVPDFWPGLKVQIFHGLGEEKKGHYDITGFFDLYCTPGPVMTDKFKMLQKKHQSFLVKETGWPKLDTVDNSIPIEKVKAKLGLDSEKPVILYAPTFSPKYTSAPAMLSALQQINVNWQWVIKFHDLEKWETVELFSALRNHITIIEGHDILPWMPAADILISDTSSVVYEFLIFDRPIITFNATTRLDKGINIYSPEDLLGAIIRCLNDPDEFKMNRKEYLDDLHPYEDGKSSYRIIETIQTILEKNELVDLRQKSPNWLNKRKIRKIVTE